MYVCKIKRLLVIHFPLKYQTKKKKKNTADFFYLENTKKKKKKKKSAAVAIGTYVRVNTESIMVEFVWTRSFPCVHC